jgi:hypothetical protein
LSSPEGCTFRFLLVIYFEVQIWTSKKLFTGHKKQKQIQGPPQSGGNKDKASALQPLHPLYPSPSGFRSLTFRPAKKEVLNLLKISFFAFASGFISSPA